MKSSRAKRANEAYSIFLCEFVWVTVSRVSELMTAIVKKNENLLKAIGAIEGKIEIDSCQFVQKNQTKWNQSVHECIELFMVHKNDKIEWYLVDSVTFSIRTF